MRLSRLYSWLGTSQSEPIPGRDMARNHAGGFTFRLDDWARLDRFLVLGTEGGTYYVGERALTVDATAATLRCLAEDGVEVVRRVVSVSEGGRAPRNDPALFALALALKRGDLVTRRAAADAVPRGARTGTHLLHLAAAVEGLGGWGRGTRRAFARWYTEAPAEKVALQVSKYANRDGWTQRDVLRLAHPVPPSDAHRALFGWVTSGELPANAAEGPLALLGAIQAAKAATTVEEVVDLVVRADLTREHLPTRWLTEPRVWEALLGAGRGMPLTALLRNLATMTRIGLLTDDGDAVREVVRRLTDAGALRAARVHPLAVLVALETYRSGRGLRGKGTWTPVPSIVCALEAAFELSFGSVAPTGRRHLLALDVSGSMAAGGVAGLSGITPRVAVAAMAMVAARTEPEHRFVAFQDRIVPLDLRSTDRLSTALAKTSGLPFGRTDCAAPMRWALDQRVPVDVFVVYTDNETWFGDEHPVEALRRYRERTGIPAKLAVVATAATGFTIADPDDAGMLDVVGFDTATPQVLADFATA
jgi:60 kDa SS-A/Ro ribonucleoprotein